MYIEQISETLKVVLSEPRDKNTSPRHPNLLLSSIHAAFIFNKLLVVVSRQHCEFITAVASADEQRQASKILLHLMFLLLYSTQ